MSLTGLCPAVGQGWMFFVPVDPNAAEAAEGEEEGTKMAKADVTTLAAAISALGLSEESRHSDFHWADMP